MMNLSAINRSAPALSKDITSIAEQHNAKALSFGKVSTNTGWKAILSGEFLGAGKTTTFTGNSLLNSIASTHGESIATKVAQQLGVARTGSKPLNSYQVAKAAALVESSDWTKVHESTINYEAVDGSGKVTAETYSCKVTLTPLGRLQSLASSKGLFGVSSTDLYNTNAVNGWVEKMEMNGTTATNIVRTGVLVPPEPKAGKAGEMTSAKRQEIAQNRYGQILSAMVETTPSVIPPEFNYDQNSKENPLPIEHAHIGLLSANKEKEAGMAQDQMNFIKQMTEGKPFQIEHTKADGTTTKLWVKPQVHYTNFSVQKAQKGNAEAPAQGTPDAETEATLDHYLGKGDDTGALETKINALPQEEQAGAQKLLGELKTLRAGRSQEGSSFYSYEFQTKYSLLLAKCGIPTHTYCKSGKDRTSRFSEMTKMWAANPDLKLNKMTSSIRNIIKAFSFSGNKTVQRLCTGFSGNKQFQTYWRLIAGEKQDRTFGGWTHLFSVGSYSGWGASTVVKT